MPICQRTPGATPSCMLLMVSTGPPIQSRARPTSPDWSDGRVMPCLLKQKACIHLVVSPSNMFLRNFVPSWMLTLPRWCIWVLTPSRVHIALARCMPSTCLCPSMSLSWSLCSRFVVYKISPVLPRCSGELSVSLRKAIPGWACSITMTTLKSIGAVPRRSRTQSIEYEDDDKSEGGTKPTAKEDAPARAMSSLEALCADDSDDATALIVLTETSLQTITPKNGHQAMNREKQCHLKNGTFGEEWTASQTYSC